VNKFEKLLTPTAKKRLVFFLLVDSLIFAFSLYLSLLLRFDFNVGFISEKGYLNELALYWLPCILLVKLSLFYLNKLYFTSWRFVSIEEFFRITVSLILALLIIMAGNFVYFSFAKTYFIPRSIVITDFFISLVLISSMRVSKRFYLERIKKINYDNKKRTLIIGAGQTGERIARELLRENDSEMYPIGFLDDDQTKQGIYIHNIKVLGKISDIDNILSSEKIDAIVVAIPSLPYTKVKSIYNVAKKHSINTLKIVPSISKLPDNFINVKDLRDIKLEDLLARKPVEIDEDSVSSFLTGKVVLVTGAAGSIGSEIVLQLTKFKPKQIIAYEIDETELYNLRFRIDRIIKEMNKEIPVDYIVGDVKDEKKLKRMFEKYNVDVVFHAAAYKHVPLMEEFPEEAVKTNIFGTYNLAKLADNYGVEKFVNISTDKAVKPSSVMGATKRIAEIICRAFNEKSKTSFISVRFGNVLGSRGSVIPIFLDQIKNGGPVTVTHPDMKRYFMTIPEAVLLVFQAASMGKGGEVFVLDMGNPVRIVGLAEELIRLNGLEPYKDIDIVFTGVRPGEKLFEELLTSEEGSVSTKHEKIYIARIKNNISLSELEHFLKELENVLFDLPSPERLKELVIKFIS